MVEAPRRFHIEGRELGYPTRFRDGCAAQGLFLADASAADALLAGSGLRVTRFAPGRTLLSLNCVHYRDTDCGSYLETAETFFVDPPQGAGPRHPLRAWSDLVRGRAASHAWALQVDSVLAQQAGLQMWGFPKSLAEISLHREGDRVDFAVRQDRRDLFRYRVTAGGARTPAPIETPVISAMHGALHVGRLRQQYRDVGVRPAGGQLELGDHPLADRLRALGLRRRPLVSIWAGGLDFEMSAPRPLAGD